MTLLAEYTTLSAILKFLKFAKEYCTEEENQKLFKIYVKFTNLHKEEKCEVRGK